MVEEITNTEIPGEETITATIFCVNTYCAYVYKLLNGDIVNEKKITLKA